MKLWFVALGFGQVRFSRVWYGWTRCGLVWNYYLSQVRHGLVESGEMRPGALRCGKVWLGGTVKSELWPGTLRLGAVWFGRVWSDLLRRGRDYFHSLILRCGRMRCGGVGSAGLGFRAARLGAVGLGGVR